MHYSDRSREIQNRTCLQLSLVWLWSWCGESAQVMKGGWAFSLVAASAAAIGMYVSARPAHAQRSLEEKMRRKASAASMQHQANQ